ncbi:MAG: sn-glycerol-3-phosphate ABC transporter ATP-binding protein UgpC [Actinobacteria bacterium]|jgi:multiple sugar transport system ATP-binding protein|nr:sn-glycerol-3-phosphate ABC transporter ATP-binding protein UgpC [Actinomycetota bacterium]
MATIELDQVSKVFPGGTKAVSELNLNVADGEFMVLVGPSGCGKTTTLRMVAGLEEVSSGTVKIGNRVVNNVSPKDRDIAMVFQNYALYPHMTVAKNIGFALRMRRTPKDVIEAKVKEAAHILGLTEVLDRKPGQLSGGQRQRVAMGRAIVREPSAFLMDEPLSNLDAKLRVQMRAEVTRIQRHLGVATLYVTHDQTEAMTMGDRVAVLKDGILQQCDTPEVLYDHPANLFVASFIGSPTMNLYEGRVLSSGDGLAVDIGDQRLYVGAEEVTTRPGLKAYKDQIVVVGIRPEHLYGLLGTPSSSMTTPSPSGTSLSSSEGGNALKVKVELVESLGSELIVHFRINAKTVEVEQAAGKDENLADLAVQGVLSGGYGQARIERSHEVKAGEDIWLSVDTNQLYFFDAKTGLAIT